MQMQIIWNYVCIAEFLKANPILKLSRAEQSLAEYELNFFYTNKYVRPQEEL